MRNLIPWMRRLPSVWEEEPADMHTLRREINRLFDGFSRHGLYSEKFDEELSHFAPKVDVAETADQVVITTELPGIDSKDVDVSTDDDELIIKGEKKEEKEENVKGYYRMERSYGSFFRSIPLPCPIDKDKTEAVFKDGVLKVTLAKTREAQKTTKKIAVKSA